MSGASTPPPVVVVKGADDAIVRDAVLKVVDGLVADGDRTLMLEDFALPDTAGGEHEADVGVADVLGAALSSVTTLPFLSDRRVVVLRGCAQLGTKDDVVDLVAYLEDPFPTSSLVLVWDLPPGSRKRRSPPPKSLVAAVEACGGEVLVVDPGRQLAAWVAEQLAGEPYRLDAEAQALLVSHLGDDPSTLVGQLTTLRGVFTANQRVTVEDLEPHLVEEGGLAPWALTDVIEQGDPAAAIVVLHRMLGPGGRHPLQVFASLISYASNLATLEGGGVATQQEAAQVLGVHPFVAGKALAQSQRLGAERVQEFVALVAEADLDLRGRRRLPDELVLEVLVARLASRSAQTGSRRRPSAGSRRGGRQRTSA